VKLLDNFRIQGPNGSHDVFVTEVLVPLTSLARYPVYEKVRQITSPSFELKQSSFVNG
jgi:hypothetical protein